MAELYYCKRLSEQMVLVQILIRAFTPPATRKETKVRV